MGNEGSSQAGAVPPPVDLSNLSEQERATILSVMARAHSLDQDQRRRSVEIKSRQLAHCPVCDSATAEVLVRCLECGMSVCPECTTSTKSSSCICSRCLARQNSLPEEDEALAEMPPPPTQRRAETTPDFRKYRASSISHPPPAEPGGQEKPVRSRRRSNSDIDRKDVEVVPPKIRQELKEKLDSIQQSEGREPRRETSRRRRPRQETLPDNSEAKTASNTNTKSSGKETAESVEAKPRREAHHPSNTNSESSAATNEAKKSDERPKKEEPTKRHLHKQSKNSSLEQSSKSDEFEASFSKCSEPSSQQTQNGSKDKLETSHPHRKRREKREHRKEHSKNVEGNTQKEQLASSNPSVNLDKIEGTSKNLQPQMKAQKDEPSESNQSSDLINLNDEVDMFPRIGDLNKPVETETSKPLQCSKIEDDSQEQSVSNATLRRRPKSHEQSPPKMEGIQSGQNPTEECDQIPSPRAIPKNNIFTKINDNSNFEVQNEVKFKSKNVEHIEKMEPSLEVEPSAVITSKLSESPPKVDPPPREKKFSSPPELGSATDSLHEELHHQKQLKRERRHRENTQKLQASQSLIESPKQSKEIPNKITENLSTIPNLFESPESNVKNEKCRPNIFAELANHATTHHVQYSKELSFTNPFFQDIQQQKRNAKKEMAQTSLRSSSMNENPRNLIANYMDQPTISDIQQNINILTENARESIFDGKPDFSLQTNSKQEEPKLETEISFPFDLRNASKIQASQELVEKSSNDIAITQNDTNIFKKMHAFNSLKGYEENESTKNQINSEISSKNGSKCNSESFVDDLEKKPDLYQNMDIDFKRDKAAQFENNYTNLDHKNFYKNETRDKISLNSLDSLISLKDLEVESPNFNKQNVFEDKVQAKEVDKPLPPVPIKPLNSKIQESKNNIKQPQTDDLFGSDVVAATSGEEVKPREEIMQEPNNVQQKIKQYNNTYQPEFKDNTDQNNIKIENTQYHEKLEKFQKMEKEESSPRHDSSRDHIPARMKQDIQQDLNISEVVPVTTEVEEPKRHKPSTQENSGDWDGFDPIQELNIYQQEWQDAIHPRPRRPSRSKTSDKSRKDAEHSKTLESPKKKVNKERKMDNLAHYQHRTLEEIENVLRQTRTTEEEPVPPRRMEVPPAEDLQQWVNRRKKSQQERTKQLYKTEVRKDKKSPDGPEKPTSNGEDNDTQGTPKNEPPIQPPLWITSEPNSEPHKSSVDEVDLIKGMPERQRPPDVTEPFKILNTQRVEESPPFKITELTSREDLHKLAGTLARSPVDPNYKAMHTPVSRSPVYPNGTTADKPTPGFRMYASTEDLSSSLARYSRQAEFRSSVSTESLDSSEGRQAYGKPAEPRLQNSTEDTQRRPYTQPQTSAYPSDTNKPRDAQGKGLSPNHDVSSKAPTISGMLADFTKAIGLESPEENNLDQVVRKPAETTRRGPGTPRRTRRLPQPTMEQMQEAVAMVKRAAASGEGPCDLVFSSQPPSTTSEKKQEQAPPPSSPTEDKSAAMDDPKLRRKLPNCPRKERSRTLSEDPRLPASLRHQLREELKQATEQRSRMRAPWFAAGSTLVHERTGISLGQVQPYDMEEAAAMEDEGPEIRDPPPSRRRRPPSSRKPRSWHPSPYVSEDEDEQLSREEKKAKIKAEIARRRRQIEESVRLHRELTKLAESRNMYGTDSAVSPAGSARHPVRPNKFGDGNTPWGLATTPEEDRVYPPTGMPLLPDMPARSRRLLENLGSSPISGHPAYSPRTPDSSTGSLVRSTSGRRSQCGVSTVYQRYNFPVKRILLTRDPKDRSVSGNGLGMKVVGGKEIVGTDGLLGAYVARIFPGGVVETLGEVKEGNQVLEWNGIPLTGRTYEEVQRIIASSADEVEIVIRSDFNMLEGMSPSGRNDSPPPLRRGLLSEQEEPPLGSSLSQICSRITCVW